MAAVDTESLRINLAESHKSIHDLQDERDRQTALVGKLESDVCDAEKKLQERTERWMGWRKNAQETIRVAKTIHKEKVKSLTTKHMEDIATETDRLKSQQYKLERSHTKQLVAMQNEIEKTKRNHELVQFFCVILFLLVCSLTFKSYSFL